MLGQKNRRHAPCSSATSGLAECGPHSGKDQGVKDPPQREGKDLLLVGRRLDLNVCLRRQDEELRASWLG